MPSLESTLHPLPRNWFAASAIDLAPKLLGKLVKKGACLGRIVETEAYMTDPASHAFRITPRSRIMRETYSHWYVYFIYGMHWCANVTTDQLGTGAILIRAVEPIEGIALMEERRGQKALRQLCSGPAKFCQAFDITNQENGLEIGESFGIYGAAEISNEQIGTSARIGIRAGKELQWRFFIKDNAFVSR